MTEERPEMHDTVRTMRPRRTHPWWALATALVLLAVLPLAALAVLVERRATASVRAEARTSLAGTVMPPPGTDFKARDWHRGVLRTGRSYVSEAIAGASPGSPLAIAIATPVRDSAGRRGVMDDRPGTPGERLLSAYAPVAGLGWTVVAELPRDRAYAQSSRRCPRPAPPSPRPTGSLWNP